VLNVPDPNELPVSNEVDALLCGDFGCPGLLFCSFAPPDPVFEGLVGDLLFPISRRYLSLLVRSVRAGCTAPGKAFWSNLFAMSLTLPGARDGRRTGCDLVLPRDLFAYAPVPAGPEALRSLFLLGEREAALCAVVEAK